MKKVQFNYYEHPTLDYAAWSTSTFFNIPGLHRLKEPFGVYIRIGAMSMALGTLTDLDEVEQKEEKMPQAGHISEDALLAALAIAQNPSLAVNLIALRNSK